MWENTTQTRIGQGPPPPSRHTRSSPSNRFRPPHLLIAAILLCITGILPAAIPDEQTVLQVLEAIRHAELQKVRKLTADMDQEAINVETPGTQTFLHTAVDRCLSKTMATRAHENPDSIEQRRRDACRIYLYLLKKGADPNARDKTGASPVLKVLSTLAGRRNPDYTIVRKLIEHGGHVDTVDYEGNNALHHYVVSYGQALRIQSSAERLRAAGKDDKAARLAANMLGKTGAEPADVTRRMVEFGVPINAVNEDGLTPLLRAMTFQAGPELIRALLDNGAEPVSIDDEARTLIHLATLAYTRDTDPGPDNTAELEAILSQLLDAGVDINAVDRRAHSALYYAVQAAWNAEKAVTKLEKQMQELQRPGSDNSAAEKRIERTRAQLDNYRAQIGEGWNIARLLISRGADTATYLAREDDKIITVSDLAAERPELELMPPPSTGFFDWLRSWLVDEQSTDVETSDKTEKQQAVTAERKNGDEAPRQEQKQAQSKPAAARKNPRCPFRDRTFPDQAVVYALAAQEGRKLDKQIDQSGSMAGQIEVTVNHTDNPVILMLGAYYPTIWNISRTPDTNIIAVLASGYHRQAVAGIDPATPVVESNMDNGTPCGSFNINRSSKAFPNHVHGNARLYFKKKITRTYMVRESKVNVGTPVAGSTKLISSPASRPQDYFLEDSELAGVAALEYAVEQGILRPATKEDLQTWFDAFRERYGENYLKRSEEKDGPRFYKPHTTYQTYVVQKAYTLPNSLHGGHAATFLVPHGAPVPEGDTGHSRILDLNTLSCKGIICAP